MIVRKLILILFVLFSLAGFSHLPTENIPDGFKKQELAPFDGEILMPKSWYYNFKETQLGFLHIISKEKVSDKPYETGFRIEYILGVNDRVGIEPYNLVNQSIETFKEKATKVIMECDEIDGETFKKRCLETIEANPNNENDDFHVIYSFFWSGKLDLVTINIFGAPVSQWEEANKIYNVMKDYIFLNNKK